MNPGVLRLSLLGSRGSGGRLAGIVAGIALGTAVFMLLAGAFTALQTREERSLWATPDAGVPVLDETGTPVPLTDDVLAVATVPDHIGSRDVIRLDVAGTPTTTVTVPGMGAIPEPGTYYASPELARLVAEHPDELEGRYGTLAGILPDDALVGPDSLVAVVGESEAAVRELPGANLTALHGTDRGVSTSYRMVVGVGAIGVFFPVLLFVSIVTQLGAAQRTERFATLRLIGASPRTVTRLVAVETVGTSTVGAILGAGLALLLRPVAGHASLAGAQFFPADLTPPLPVALGAVVAVVVGTTAAAARKLRRTGIGPLGATATIQERRPSPWRVLPLMLGLAMMGALFVAVRRGTAGPGIGFALLLGGFAVTTLGVVVAGPWLTYRASEIAARRARTASAVIAGSRVRRHPVATFRAVSGLVVAVFTVTVFSVAATSADPYLRMADATGLMPTDALIAQLPPGADADAVVAAVRQVPGVTGTAVLSVMPEMPLVEGETPGDAVAARTTDADVLGVIGDTSSSSEAMTFSRTAYLSTNEDAAVSPASTLETDFVPVDVVVRTDGTRATIETARTALGRAGAVAPETRAEYNDVGNRQVLDELSLLAYAGALFSIAIAGCSLAVATAAAMLDRRRVLGLLRLVGMPVRNLRRIVALEAAAPLIAVLGLSVVLGFGVAWLLVESVESEMSIGWPDPAYFVTLAIGCLVALGMVAAASSTIRRDTALETTRFE